MTSFFKGQLVYPLSPLAFGLNHADNIFKLTIHLLFPQLGLSGNNPQRSHPSQMSSDQMFNMGGGNPGGMIPDTATAAATWFTSIW
ncbi:hypothetical protein JHK85_002209 [Glycine max]|nr:hypothetical protein JHK85_002209 [Glycine max]KHN36170.1 hypothetical protein glysoja_003293 [Glycine soja]